jgi:hypothetical protein
LEKARGGREVLLMVVILLYTESMSLNGSADSADRFFIDSIASAPTSAETISPRPKGEGGNLLRCSTFYTTLQTPVFNFFLVFPKPQAVLAFFQMTHDSSQAQIRRWQKLMPARVEFCSGRSSQFHSTAVNPGEML